MTNQAGLKMAAPPPLRGSVCVRAVVINVYFADDPGAREELRAGMEPKSLSCDVLTYGGGHRHFLPRVPVTHRGLGINDHSGVRPIRPTTVDLSTGVRPIFSRSLEGEPTGDPRNFDGDHVIVEFFENDPGQPFIRDSLPHPHASYRQLKADGGALHARHHGVQVAVDQDGNVVIDASRACSGAIDPLTGDETPADDGAHGNVTLALGRNATLQVVGLSPDGAVKTFELTMKDGEFEVKLQDGDSFKVAGNGDATTVTVGTGASSAVRGEHLQALYELLKTAYNAHVHPDGFGSTAPTPVPAPEWDPNILSTRVKIPDS